MITAQGLTKRYPCLPTSGETLVPLIISGTRAGTEIPLR
jgi:hypothetical protein